MARKWNLRHGGACASRTRGRGPLGPGGREMGREGVRAARDSGRVCPRAGLDSLRRVSKP
jgi:hypothetical protein